MGEKQSPIADMSRIKLLILFSVIGTLISLYLTKEHYNESGIPSICDNSERFSCSVVNKSSYSELFGVPIAFFGALWFVVVILGSIKVLANDRPHEFVLALLLWSVLGILSAIYLIGAEFALGTICPFCTILHVLIFGVLYESAMTYMDLTVKPTFDMFLHKLKWYLLLVLVINIMPVAYFREIREDNIPELVQLAECLTQNNIKMFGSDSCGVCKRQKSLFGVEAFKFIEYIECGQRKEDCNDNKVEGYPTWIQFDEAGVEVTRQQGYKSKNELIEFSGCKITPVVQPAQVALDPGAKM